MTELHATAPLRCTGRADRHDGQVSGACVPRDLRVDVVEIPDPRRRQHLVDRSGGEHRPSFSITSVWHSAAAKFRSWVETTTESACASWSERRSDAGLELVLQVQCGRGFVEQEDRGLLRRPRRSAEICASAAAMMTRCFSPPLRVENMRASSASVPVDASAARASATSRGPSICERAEVRIASHQDDFEHAVFEGELRLLRHDRHAPRDLAARQRRRAACRRGARRPAAAFACPRAAATGWSCRIRSGR